MVMKSILEKDLFGVDDRTILIGAEKEVYLFSGLGFGVVPGEVFRQFVGIDHDGGLLNRTSPEKHVVNIFGAGGKFFNTNGFT